MEGELNSILRVPITDAERQSQRRRSLSDSSQRDMPTQSLLQHERDRQFTPQIGRFSSLRQPGERYDDPDPHLYATRGHARSSTLPGIDEGSHYSDHDDEEPLTQSTRATPFLRTNETAYQPVSRPPEPHARAAASSYMSSSQLWQPIWLRKSSLALMVALLLILFILLIVVGRVGESRKGYHVSSTTEHYLWTHIPTLVFVILVVFWRQIDFHAKTLMPWKELSLGPLNPSETVFVDYISGFQITSFLAALKRLHRSVLITIVAFLLAKSITIAATALFIVQSKTFTDRFPTVLNSTFDAAALAPTILSAGAFPNSSVYAYAQTVANGLGPQIGVAPGYAYILPVLHSDSEAVPTNSTFSVVADTFVPRITCRAANVTLDGESTISTTNFPYNSTETPYGTPSNITLSINESNLCGSWPQLTFAGLDPLHYVVPTKQLESRSEEVHCEDASNSAPIILLTMVEVQYTQDLLTNVSRPEGGDLPIALDTSRSVSRMVNVLCQADYTLSQVNITNNSLLDGAAALSFSSIPKPNDRTLNGLSAANMTAIYNSLLSSDTGLFSSNPDPDFIRTPAFDLFAFSLSGTYDDLFQSDNLIKVAQQVYNGTMPDFASKNLVSKSPSGSQKSGPVASVTWTEERLFPNWTAVVIVLTGLGILALLTIALILFMPESVVPRDPNSIAAAATTLARSPELNRLLRKQHSPHSKGLEAALNGYNVGTAIASEEADGSQSFKIHVSAGRPQRAIPQASSEFRYWNPVWASLPVAAATFCLPLLFIAILEITQHQSDTKHGLFDVPDDKGTVIGSHYVPAFVTLVIAAVIGSLNFYICLFSPWTNLLKTRARPEHSILTNVLGHSVASAIWKSIKGRYWGAMLSNAATIFAALLTVIVSGLFVVEHFDADGPSRTLSRLDQFDISRTSTYTVDNDGGAAAMLNLISHNSTFPSFTLDEYAFPRMSLKEYHDDIGSGSRLVGSMRVNLPALRGNISCVDATSHAVSTVDSSVRVTGSYNLPDTCAKGIGSELNGTSVTFSTDFYPAQGKTEFGGRQFDLRFGTNSSLYGHLGENNASLVADNPPVGCPSLAFIWGNFALGNDNNGAVNVAICYQRLQAVNVNVTLQQNTTDLDPRHPIPPPNDTHATAQNNPNGTTDIFDFRIQNNLARQLGTYFNDRPNIDPFFQAMLNGSIQMDIDRFLSNRQTAMMGISHTYRRYMAQVINAMLRENLAGTNTRLMPRQQSTLPDAKTSIRISRLVQDNPSKIILQVFLGLAAVFSLAGFLLTKIRNVLPCNPCSIAGTMSLLAGSELCYTPDSGICECCGKVRKSPREPGSRGHISINASDNEYAEAQAQFIRPGAEWMDDRTFARIFEGKTYSLGWWEESVAKGQARRYGVDYGGPTEQEDGAWYLGKRKNNENLEIFADTADQRGRPRGLSDVNERGTGRGADPSPGIGGDAHEMGDLTPLPRMQAGRNSAIEQGRQL